MLHLLRLCMVLEKLNIKKSLMFLGQQIHLHYYHHVTRRKSTATYSPPPYTSICLGWKRLTSTSIHIICHNFFFKRPPQYPEIITIDSSEREVSVKKKWFCSKEPRWMERLSRWLDLSDASKCIRNNAASRFISTTYRTFLRQELGMVFLFFCCSYSKVAKISIRDE